MKYRRPLPTGLCFDIEGEEPKPGQTKSQVKPMVCSLTFVGTSGTSRRGCFLLFCFWEFLASDFVVSKGRDKSSCLQADVDNFCETQARPGPGADPGTHMKIQPGEVEALKSVLIVFQHNSQRLWLFFFSETPKKRPRIFIYCPFRTRRAQNKQN